MEFVNRGINIPKGLTDIQISKSGNVDGIGKYDPITSTYAPAERCFSIKGKDENGIEVFITANLGMANAQPYLNIENWQEGQAINYLVMHKIWKQNTRGEFTQEDVLFQNFGPSEDAAKRMLDFKRSEMPWLQWFIKEQVIKG